ncbi:MAG: GPR endopeptidase [Clostridia bacterium]|nr:GPR endopeptidase [Clostridia bacterium]
MTAKRTDLADELLEIAGGKLPGIRIETIVGDPLPAQMLTVDSDEAGRSIGKEKGRYVTLELGKIWDRRDVYFTECSNAVADCLSRLLPSGLESVLVVGLGNRNITPDALGPVCADHIMVTRHLVDELPDLFGNLRPVSALQPGVLGLTGVETGEIVKGVCEKCSPSAVIAVDALASRRVSRVLRTVQLTDSGIMPASGLGQTRFPLNMQTLGIPCIAIGVPTVVDALTLTADVLEDAGITAPEGITQDSEYSRMLVTPRDIDAEMAVVAKIIGYGINLALQPGYDCEAINAFLA